MFIRYEVIALAIVFVTVTMLYCPVQAVVTFQQISGDVKGEVRIQYLYGLVNVKKQLKDVNAKVTGRGPVVQTFYTARKRSQADVKKSTLGVSDIWGAIVHWQDWVNLFSQMLPIVRRFLQQVAIPRFKAHILVGTGDVVTSGMASGSLSAALHSIVGYLTFVSRFDEPPVIEVNTDFQQPVFNSEIECIFRVRAGHAIVAALRLVRVWKRRSHHGTSHPGSHANSDGKYSGNG